jgi:ketosteroid isomerase-like protein
MTMDTTLQHPAAIDTVLAFLAAIERGAPPDELGTFLAEDVRQREHPSLVSPHVAERGRTAMLTGSVAGRQLLARQRYDVDEVVSSGDRVVLRLRWTGTLAVPFRGLSAGHELLAHVAMFLTVRDGLITQQTSYDCYEPFEAAGRAGG